MRHSMKYILFAAILFFPISTIGAYACTCDVFRPPCEEYGSCHSPKPHPDAKCLTLVSYNSS